MSIITDVDSYKVTMFLQYPPLTQFVSSYVEARGSNDPDYNESVFFGIQYWIREYLMKPITQDDIDEAEVVFGLHGVPFPKEGWQTILDEFGGYLPLKIEAIPEGTVLPLSNVLAQVVNTDMRFYWLTTWIETSLLRTIWYATTVATNSRTIKKELKKFYKKSGSVQGLDFKLHDFGSRGVSSKESAGIGGLAHLINFMGTDTIEAVMFGRKYYDIDMAGFSIPASEHSTMTTWGRANEGDAMENMLNQFEGFPVIAVVSDSYNIYEAVDELWGKRFKHRILDGKQVVVVRPDSGDALTVPIVIIQKLMDKYGYTMNEQGYRTLPDQIRVIQGDGITKDSIKGILANMEDAKLSLDNLAFGMGSGMLQQVNRDTLKFAMKASAIIVNGECQDVWKDPVEGGKQSKRGILGLYVEDGEYVTKRWTPNKALDLDIMKVIYRDGIQYVNTTFDEIRERAVV